MLRKRDGRRVERGSRQCPTAEAVLGGEEEPEGVTSQGVLGISDIDVKLFPLAALPPLQVVAHTVNVVP